MYYGWLIYIVFFTEVSWRVGGTNWFNHDWNCIPSLYYNSIIHTALNLVMLRNVVTVDCTCINQYKFKDRKLKTELTHVWHAITAFIRSCTLDFSGMYVLQTDLELIMRKKVLLPGQGTNYTVHGLCQLLLVHTRKRESKERLDLGKKFPESNLPSTQKGHDYGRATFARLSFFKRIQLLLEMVMQITWSCYHGQRKYQY